MTGQAEHEIDAIQDWIDRKPRKGDSLHVSGVTFTVTRERPLTFEITDKSGHKTKWRYIESGGNR